MELETEASCIRIVLVDDHRSILWGLEKLIDSAAPRMQVVATATSSAAALEAIEAHAPDMVLLDLDLGGEDGLELLAEIRRRRGPRVVILTGIRAADVIQRAVVEGACGLINKSEPAEVLLRAIECVHRGELWLDRSTTAKVVASLWDRSARPAGGEGGGEDPLTATERRIVAAVIEYKGAPNKVIADALHISQHTLRNHLASIYGKFGVHRRLDLVLHAMEKGLHKIDEPGFARSRASATRK
jgi:two-component system, NarL family, nitrate/nitrite response regulator NarL